MEELHRTYRTSSRSLFQFLDVQRFVQPVIMISLCSHRIVNLAIVHFQWLVLVRGTLSRLNLKLSPILQFSNVNSKHFYLQSPILANVANIITLLLISYQRMTFSIIVFAAGHL